MSSRVNKIYIGPTMPSFELEAYLGQYIDDFNVLYCYGSNYQVCIDEIQQLTDDGKLMHSGQQVHSWLLPVIIKGQLGYVVEDTEEFNQVVGCGSL